MNSFNSRKESTGGCPTPTIREQRRKARVAALQKGIDTTSALQALADLIDPKVTFPLEFDEDGRTGLGVLLRLIATSSLEVLDTLEDMGATDDE